MEQYPDLAGAHDGGGHPTRVPADGDRARGRVYRGGDVRESRAVGTGLFRAGPSTVGAARPTEAGPPQNGSFYLW